MNERVPRQEREASSMQGDAEQEKAWPVNTARLLQCGTVVTASLLFEDQDAKARTAASQSPARCIFLGGNGKVTKPQGIACCAVRGFGKREVMREAIFEAFLRRVAFGSSHALDGARSGQRGSKGH